MGRLGRDDCTDSVLPYVHGKVVYYNTRVYWQLRYRLHSQGGRQQPGHTGRHIESNQLESKLWLSCRGSSKALLRTISCQILHKTQHLESTLGMVPYDCKFSRGVVSDASER